MWGNAMRCGLSMSNVRSKVEPRNADTARPCHDSNRPIGSRAPIEREIARHDIILALRRSGQTFQSLYDPAK
jgi:hypothetical protein